MDIVDVDYDYKENSIKLCKIISKYINNINWLKIKTEGILGNKLIDLIDEDEKNFIKIDDLEIKVGISGSAFYANVRDLSNSSEICFSLLNLEEDSNENMKEILKFCLGLDGFNIWGNSEIYYKDIFCTRKVDGNDRFHMKINFVMNNAKNLLSINRNRFTNITIINSYMERINIYILDKVISQMWKFVRNNYKLLTSKNSCINLNIVMLALYYKRFCDNKLDLNDLDNNPIFNNTILKGLKKVTNEGIRNVTVKDIVNEEKIVITVKSYNECEIISESNDLKVVYDNCNRINISNKGYMEILNFDKLEYIDKDTLIAYKDSNNKDFNILSLDVNKPKSVRNLLSSLYFKSDNIDYTELRRTLRAFEYIGKPGNNIKYLIINNYRIISPFTKYLDDEVFEKNCEECIEELKKKHKFNDLIEYVYKNSLYKISVEESECKKVIEDAYKELIDDYINFVYKESNITTEQYDLNEMSDNITEEQEAAPTVDDIKEKEANETSLK